MSKYFYKQKDIYLASADRVNLLEKYANELKDTVDSYFCVIGGLGGLNLIKNLKPRKIYFYDINKYALPYAKFIVGLIKLCSSREDFISRVFSRKLDFELVLENQSLFLTKAVDSSLKIETQKMLKNLAFNYLDILSEGTYKNGLFYIHEKLTNCSILLPCFPENRDIPLFQNTIIRVNSFFYNYGWLKNNANFLKTKEILLNAEIFYRNWDLVNEAPKIFKFLSKNSYIYISNIDDWVGNEEWKRFQFFVKKCDKKINYISLYHGIKENI